MHSEHHHEITGDIFATGEGSVDINFEEKPHDVFVFFYDEPVPSPCNPGGEDELCWSVHKQHHGHHWILKISWKVNSSRKIKWKAREEEF